MALLYCDGFRQYANGTLNADNYPGLDYFIAGTAPVIIEDSLATNGVAVRGNASSFGNAILSGYGGNEIILGCAMIQSGPTMHIGLGLTAGTSGIGVFFITIDGLGTPILAESTGTIGQSIAIRASGPSGMVPSGTKAFLELKKIGTQIEGRVNGITVFTYTLPNANIQNPCIFTRSGTDSGGRHRIFDLYICDTSGGVNNDFLGEISVPVLFPDENLVPQEWDVTGAASAFAAINQRGYSSGRFISTDEELAQSNFGIAPIPFEIFEIFGVQTVWRGDKSSSAPASARMDIISGGQIATGEIRNLVEATPTSFTDIHETDPATGTAWNPLTFDPSISIVRTE